MGLKGSFHTCRHLSTAQGMGLSSVWTVLGEWMGDRTDWGE